MERENNAAYKILKEAAFEVQRLEMAQSKERLAQTGPHTFSKRFERNMRRIIKTGGKPPKTYPKFLNTAGKRVAAVVIGIVLALSALTFSVEAIREPVVRFFVGVFEKFTGVVFHKDGEPNESDAEDRIHRENVSEEDEEHNQSQNADEADANPVTDAGDGDFPEIIEQRYQPEHLPDGYSMANEIDGGNISLVFYSKEGLGDISFQQNTITSKEVLADTEGVETENLIIEGVPALFYTNKEVNTLIWADNSYGYKLFGDISKEEMLKMAKLIPLENG
jgi:hypothetical protein